MDWLIDLFAGSTIAHALFIYSIVIAIGVILGKVKFFGISLGATFVLFVGILAGHLGHVISPDQAFVNQNTLKFIQEFGLILFVFSIGLQVGPSFFSSFKEGGMLLNGLALCIIGLNIVVALAIYFGIGGIEPNEIVGILSGAVTNTPGLGAAQQALIETKGDAASLLNEQMSMGYAAAYPLGVVGIILSMILVKAIFKINIKNDAKEIEDDNANSLLKPHVVTYKVTNKLIFDRTIKRLHDIMDRNFVISRVKKKDGAIVIPVNDTVVAEGDLLRVVISEQDEEVFDAVIGPKVEFDWKVEQTPVVSRRIVVTNSEFSGRKLGSLRLPKGY
ncbi:MAG: transporter, partial [Muribaculaceae bacterium]|nr:transporter [Muribaculaceae bacterium]